MARGPQGQYRPTDPVANAITVGRIATGDTNEEEVAARAVAESRSRSKRKTAKALHEES